MKEIIQVLNMFPEVRWDRYTEYDGELNFYGWIPREDLRSDFVEIGFLDGVADWFSTSSSKYSLDFWLRLGWKEEEHRDCKRVEWLFKNNEVECIKLKK